MVRERTGHSVYFKKRGDLWVNQSKGTARFALTVREDACCPEHAYDKAGNGLFSYNSRHQQTRVVIENGNVQENRYDVENLRFELLENGNRTAFVYHNGELLYEEGGEEKQTGYHLGAGTSAFQRGQETYYYHRDEQLSTAFITGADGTVRNSYQYDAFGNLSDTIEQLPNRVRYTGQQYDALTGQYYLRARYYNPIVGRFMQEDTYQGDGLNLYVYCKNNPVAYWDPSGYNQQDQKSGCVEPKFGEDDESKGNRVEHDATKNQSEGVTYEGPLYRNVGTMPNGTPVNPLEISDFTNSQNYRYTQNGQNGLYFASSQHVMEGEMSAYGANPYADNRTTYCYDNVTIDNMLDLTNSNTRAELGVELSDLVSSDYKNYTTTDASPAVTHSMGNYAAQNGYTGLIVPSARADGGVNIVIFDPKQIDFGTYITIHDKF